jgi:uncharacterized oxidoreductase
VGQLTNRTILITGGSRGIGLALVELLAKTNKVLITGRNSETLEAVKTRFPEVTAFECDVADPGQIDALKKKIEKSFPTLDMLFNNAGIAQTVNLTREVEDAFLMRELEVNLKGVIRMVNAFLPVLLKQPHALIVNVSSGLAYLPFPSQPIYCAAKAGVHSYTISLRQQLAKTAVKVIEVLPPVVETDMTAKITAYKKMSALTHAEKVIAGITRGKTEIRPGISQMLYLASRLIPAATFKQMAKNSK